MSATRIIEWRPLRRNSLLGFAKIELPSGMIIADVTILTGARGPWASPPAKPLIDRDGAVMKDATTGKVRYAPIIEFTSKEIRDRWSAAVIEAMRAAHPEIFEP
jgi:hypothetical protein